MCRFELNSFKKLPALIPVSWCRPETWQSKAGLYKIMNLSAILFVNSWAPRGRAFYSLSWNYHLLPMSMFTCGMFIKGIFQQSKTSPVFFCSCLNTVKTCCWHCKLKISNLPKWMKFIKNITPILFYCFQLSICQIITLSFINVSLRIQTSQESRL